MCSKILSDAENGAYTTQFSAKLVLKRACKNGVYSFILAKNAIKSYKRDKSYPISNNSVDGGMTDLRGDMMEDFIALVACLFYGAPGTGKTETVYQLARRTGRNIMRVNISEIKSSWVGESEKNIKNVFNKYRFLVERSEAAPILLFNEADAILGKRMEGAERAVDRMENSIQNIILQEIENMEGILIATTNIAGNLDKAFERRFLYKIEFERPDIQAKCAIWKSMLPELNEDEAECLASRYDFSGGQIENICRKRTIDSILWGSEILDFEKLKEHCESEIIQPGKTERRGCLKIKNRDKLTNNL